MIQRFFPVLAACLILLSSPGGFSAEDSVSGLPAISVNGQPAEVTAQDLSGLGTRPLRLLVERNNRARHEGFLRVHALGVREGDEVAAALAAEEPGVRITVYRLLCARDGHRYLSMPASVYFEEPRTETYRQKIEPAKEEFLVFVYEHTESPETKGIQIRYFEERARKLELSSYKTNLFFSSLKLKLKDYGDEQNSQFFERDGQLLIDRMIDPRKIVILRLWRQKG
jgi:hypothetical protein